MSSDRKAPSCPQQVRNASSCTTISIVLWQRLPCRPVTRHRLSRTERSPGRSRTPPSDLSELECYSAGDWLNRIMAIDSPVAPGSAIEWVQNHSWVQTFTDEVEPTEVEDALLRIDYATERDSVLSIVGLINGSATPVPPLMATAFNVISVGLSNGQHSRGGTVTAFTQPGRTKPEIVAPHSRTSFSAAAVSSAAAFLLDEVFRRLDTHQSALRPEVMKAIILAGATQQELTNWNRTPSVPLDTVYGAGELNLSRSHLILTQGEQTSTVANWSAIRVSSNETTSFTFQIPQGQIATRLTAALCWNRHVANASTNGDFTLAASLPNMTLTLTLFLLHRKRQRSLNFD
ncbi:MAG: hypothetical protein ACI9R3_005577 [Verrucomicrobiales bacterium]|jgi:hypothetical protein